MIITMVSNHAVTHAISGNSGMHRVFITNIENQIFVNILYSLVIKPLELSTVFISTAVK